MLPLFKNWRTTFERVDKFISKEYFTDVNLYGKIIEEEQNISEIHHLEAVTSPSKFSHSYSDPIDSTALTFEQVQNMPQPNWHSVDKDDFKFGPSWSVHWFHVRVNFPVKWCSRVLDHSDNHDWRIQLHWKSECEVLVFSQTGKAITGLNSNHDRTEVDLTDLVKESTDSSDAQYCFFLQACCCQLFGVGGGGLISAPDEHKTFRVERACLALVCGSNLRASRDLRILLDLAQSYKEEDLGHRALYTANAVVNRLSSLSSSEGYLAAVALLDEFFVGSGESARAGPVLHALGHCHIDTAWLWRFTETRRKTARSWATTLNLMDHHPSMVFVCSQAQQLEWLKQDYPDLFSRIQEMASRGRFLPVGGTWVEMDVNMPNFESLCRQFLYGQRFFKANFGRYCREFWLPDTFGYSPQLPQLMRMAGISRFLTQKLSWSLVNKFPHHTFIWKGLDDSSVLAHFPPGDSYSMSGKVEEILKTVNNNADKGRVADLMYLYGHGDGGQGPTEEMLYSLDRLQNCDRMPKIVHSTPDRFFESINEANLCTWRGELYLELHNGTYTTHRKIKQLNAHCEWMLRLVDMLLACCSVTRTAVKGSCQGDRQSLISNSVVVKISSDMEECWKKVLLCQFHDVLPGSCIRDVADDAFWLLTDVLDRTKSFAAVLTRFLLNADTSVVDSAKRDQYFYNPTSWPLQILVNECYQNLPPWSVSNYSCLSTSSVEPGILEVTKSKIDNHFIVKNRHFRIEVDQMCRIVSLSLMVLPHIGNLLKGPANQLCMYDDVPLFWDAWDVMDYHLETRTPLSEVTGPCEVVAPGLTLTRSQHEISLKVTLRLTNSGTTIDKTVTVSDELEYVTFSTDVREWRENHRLLKAEFPLAAVCESAAYATQAGWQSRPNHRNSSWDAAKFEVCSHRWLALAETNWGCALLKDSVFGSSLADSCVSLSLLRSPKSPDPEADRIRVPHEFRYALLPFAVVGSTEPYARISRLAEQFQWKCVARSCGLNSSLMAASLELEKIEAAAASVAVRLVSPSGGQVSIDCVKTACDQPRSIVLRVQEQCGGRYSVNMHCAVPLAVVHQCDIMENVLSINTEALTIRHDRHSIELMLPPFRCVSLLIHFEH